MSDAVPSSWFHRIWSTRPITLLLVVVIVGLHGVVRWNITPERGRATAYRELGLLEIQKSLEHSELFGPFDLWAGEWWRVPLGGLHHAGWWQLALVVFGLLYLGSLLEPKMHRATYAGFLLGALFVTTIPRWLGGDSVPAWFIGKEPITGLSGVIFAQFGLLLMLRRNDRELSENFGEGGILLGMLAGLGCLAFSTIGLIGGNVDNLAHLAGFPYGLSWGFALSASSWARWFLVAGLLAAHLVLWPLIAGLMQPLENGRYRWWLAEQTDDADFQKACYHKALDCDPDLEHPWLALAELEWQTQQPAEAWRTLVKGLQQHPRLDGSEQLSQRIWEAFATAEDRNAAWQEADRKLSDPSRDPHDWSDRMLMPRQSAAYHMEQHEPLEAWFFLMRSLRDLPPPKRAAGISQLPEAAEVAGLIWRNLSTKADRKAALEVLDEQLEHNRRAWHLAIIPHRDLIPHYQRQGELLWAWQAVMEELRDDPAFHPTGTQIAGEIWESLPSDLRRHRARKIVRDIFGVNALAWQIELGILSDADKQRYRLDQSLNLPADDFNAPPVRIPAVNPDDPTSAALGDRL